MNFDDVEKAYTALKAKRLRGTYISIAVIAIGIIFGIITGFSRLPDIFQVIYLIAFWVLIPYSVIQIVASKESAAYKKAYKAYFVKKNLEKTFTDLKYNHENGLDSDILRNTQMVYTGDRYDSNDLTTGKYQDVGFTQADVHIQIIESDGESTNYVTIFKGRFMIYEFPKKFTFRLEVVEKGFGSASRIPGKDSKTGRKFEKISLESGEFNQVFTTYAEDGFEAFYILDPDLMDNLLELSEEYQGKILLCFVDNKLVVGLKDGKDAFEPPSIFKSLDEKTETDKIAKDIHLITNFVDKLKLNHKLFK